MSVTDLKMDQDAAISTSVLTRMTTIVTVSMDSVSIKKENIDVGVMMDTLRQMTMEPNAPMSTSVKQLILKMYTIVISMPSVMTWMAASTVPASMDTMEMVLFVMMSMNVALVTTTVIQILDHVKISLVALTVLAMKVTLERVSNAPISTNVQIPTTMIVTSMLSVTTLFVRITVPASMAGLAVDSMVILPI